MDCAKIELQDQMKVRNCKPLGGKPFQVDFHEPIELEYVDGDLPHLVWKNRKLKFRLESSL
jgi:hypothetical protein